jgi:hypothetical protein
MLSQYCKFEPQVICNNLQERNNGLRSLDKWIQMSMPINKDRFPFERNELILTEYAKGEAHTMWLACSLSKVRMST